MATLDIDREDPAARTVSAALDAAAERIAAAGVENARADAEVLVADAMGVAPLRTGRPRSAGTPPPPPDRGQRSTRPVDGRHGRHPRPRAVPRARDLRRRARPLAAARDRACWSRWAPKLPRRRPCPRGRHRLRGDRPGAPTSERQGDRPGAGADLVDAGALGQFRRRPRPAARSRAAARGRARRRRSRARGTARGRGCRPSARGRRGAGPAPRSPRRPRRRPRRRSRRSARAGLTPIASATRLRRRRGASSTPAAAIRSAAASSTALTVRAAGSS